jgi:hypothetical protein
MAITYFDFDDLQNLCGHGFDDCDMDWVNEIADDMTLNGWHGDPVIVCRPCWIVNGRHRALAAKIAGIMIPAIIIDADKFDRLESECCDLEDVANTVLEELSN